MKCFSPQGRLFFFSIFLSFGCSDAVVLPSTGGGTQDVGVSPGEVSPEDTTGSTGNDASIDGLVDGPIGAECKSAEDCVVEGGNVCVAWTCNAGVCGTIPVSDGTQCDDMNACTESSACQNAECVSEETDLCNDGNPCTKGTCSPETGCSWENVTFECDDDDPCTVDDLCVDGECQGGALDCDDGNVCTTDACDTAKGCVHENNAEPCDDNDVCTLGDGCLAGGCQGSEALVCQDDNPCTEDGCDTETGCFFEFNAVPCDDGDACTEGDSCASGACIGSSLDCTDAYPCTFDSCDEQGNCVHVAQQDFCENPGEECTDVSCLLDGGCTYVTDDAKCDDGFSCTLDTCSSFKGCENIPDSSLCTLDGNECLVFTCTALDGCVSTPDKSLCEDAFPCTVETCGEGDGVCTLEAVDELCVDEDADCFTFSCSADSGCLSSVIEGACDDGIACTLDSCGEAGQCAHEPTLEICEADEEECFNAIECSGVEGCVYEKDQASCDDGLGCTVDACQDNGTCSNITDDSFCVDDGTECFDYSCVSGEGCITEVNAMACDDGVNCTSDNCGPEGMCQNIPDITVCEGLTGDCLVADTCSPETGCSFSEDDAACDDGQNCTFEECEADGTCATTFDDNSCDDGNPCTDDTCAVNGCNYDFNTAPCEAGDSCGGDVCEDGECIVHYEANCVGKCMVVGVAALSAGNGVCNALYDCQTFEDDGGDCNACPLSTSFEQQVQDCAGICRSGAYLESQLGDGICKSNMDCERFAFDGGDCECDEGMIRDCQGTCFPASEIFDVLGDGVCHMNGGGGLPAVACEEFGVDAGDCTLGNTNSGGISSVVNCVGGVSTLSFIMTLLNGPLGCMPVLDCSKFDYSEGKCLNGCGQGLLPSCLHETGLGSADCIPMTYYLPKIGNGQCDLLLDCERFNFDDGDCAN